MPDSIETAIARLAVSTEHIQQDIGAIKREMREDNVNAAASRAKIHERLDDIVERTVSLEKDTTVIQRTLLEVQEVTDDVTRWKAAGMGALGVTGIASSAITAGVAFYWKDILAFFKGHI